MKIQQILVPVALSIGAISSANALLITLQPDGTAGKDAAIGVNSLAYSNSGNIHNLTFNIGTSRAASTSTALPSLIISVRALSSESSCGSAASSAKQNAERSKLNISMSMRMLIL
jgi:hypothetical protein